MLSSSDSSVFRRDFFYMITCNKCLAYSGVLQMCTCLWPGGRTAAHLAGFQTVSVVLFSCAWSVARSVKHQLPDARERARTSNTISMSFGALLRKGCLSCIIRVCVSNLISLFANLKPPVQTKLLPTCLHRLRSVYADSA